MRGVFAPVTEEKHGEGDEEIGDCEPRHVSLQRTTRLALWDAKLDRMLHLHSGPTAHEWKLSLHPKILS